MSAQLTTLVFAYKRAAECVPDWNARNRSDKFFFFFFLQIHEVGGFMTIQKRAQPNLATCQRGKQNSLGIQPATCLVPLLRSCCLIMAIWPHGPIFSHNVMTWAVFSPPQKTPFLPFAALFFGRQDEKFGPQKHHLVMSQVLFFQPANERMKYILGTCPWAFFCCLGVSFSLSLFSAGLEFGCFFSDVKILSPVLLKLCKTLFIDTGLV